MIILIYIQPTSLHVYLIFLNVALILLQLAQTFRKFLLITMSMGISNQMCINKNTVTTNGSICEIVNKRDLNSNF